VLLPNPWQQGTSPSVKPAVQIHHTNCMLVIDEVVDELGYSFT
jgi:hypothetical protein